MTTRTLPVPVALGGRRVRTWISEPARQALTFAAVGVASTLAYVALYAIAREAMPATVANCLALVLTAVGNTAANRRLTFRVRGRERLGRDHAAGLVVFAAALAITSAALAVLAVVAPDPPRAVEIAVLVAANALATLVRFLVLRRALAGSGRGAVTSPARRLTGGAPSAHEGTAR